MRASQNLILIFLLLINYKSYAQSKIYFSSSGDTVLTIHGARATSMRLDTIDWLVVISVSNEKHSSIDTLSSFLIRTFHYPEEPPYNKINKDTLSKYNLEYDGESIDLLDYETSIEPITVRLIQTDPNGGKNLYHALIRISTTYKSEIIGTVESQISFLGKTATDIDYEDTYYSYVWKKQNKNKFLLQFRLKSIACRNVQSIDCHPYERNISVQF